MYEVVSRHDSRVGVIRPTLTEARRLAEPGDAIYVLDGNHERVARYLERDEVRPGMRLICGQWFYSAAWL